MENLLLAGERIDIEVTEAEVKVRGLPDRYQLIAEPKRVPVRG